MIWETSCHGCLILKADGTYETLAEGSYLDLPYRVGNTNNLTVIEYEEDGETVKTYFGNILTSITFYYVDYYDNIIEDTVIECLANQSLLEAIKTCDNKVKAFKETHKDDNHIAENHYYIKEEIRCSLTYHMGAVFDANYELLDSGITYKDETYLTEKSFEYKFDEFSSMMLKYYEFTYNETYDKLNEYSNSSVLVGKSYFEYSIDNVVNSTTANEYRAKHDGMIAAPVFRQEYKLGSAMMENIESDIYIDRGFSASFEKHLNLLNVRSMEALSQFRKWIL